MFRSTFIYPILIAIIQPFAHSMDGIVYNIGLYLFIHLFIECIKGTIHGIEEMVWRNVKHAVDEWNSVHLPLPVKLVIPILLYLF
jgi:hypothetical protein